MKKLRAKILVLLGIMLTVFYFSSDFTLIDIEKTAIVVAMAIDKTEQGEYEITAEIGLPQATDQAAANDDAIISSNGKTVMEAIDVLGANTGWHPKLSFCNLFILGRNVIDGDFTPIIDNLLASEHVQNSALVAMSDTTAKDVLMASTPLDAISAFALQKILLKNNWAASSVAAIDLKDYSLIHHSRAKSGYMPIIKIVKGDNKGKEGGSSAVTASYNYEKRADNALIAPLFENFDKIKPLGESGESSGGGEEPNIVFDASTTAVFDNGKLVCELTEEQTTSFNLLVQPSNEILLEVDTGEETTALEVVKSKSKTYLTFLERPTLNLDLTLTVRVADTTEQKGRKKLGRRAEVDKKYLDALESKMKGVIEGFCEETLEGCADLFRVRELIYKYYNKDYDDYKNIPLSSYYPAVKVTVKSDD